MKTTSLLSFVFLGAFVLSFSLASASEVTGQLSSSSNSAPSGSEVGGTFGGGNSSGNNGSVSGTVSGGSSSGRGGGSTFVSSNSSGGSSSSGNLSTTGNTSGGDTSQGFLTPPSVLGISTNVSNSSSGNDTGTEDEGNLALGNDGSATTQGDDSLAAAIGVSDFKIGWWFWVLLGALFVGASAYTYRRYY